MELNITRVSEEVTPSETPGGTQQLGLAQNLKAELKALPPGVVEALKGIHLGAYTMLTITGPIALNWTEESKTIRVTLEAVPPE